MKNLKEKILEKLTITANSKINQEKIFTDEELRNDYSEVGGAYTKAEKQVFCNKYHVNSNKIREIQIVILDKLRENRQTKKEFTQDDVHDFLRYDLPEKYEKFVDYLDKEPKEFVEYILESYKDIIKRNRIVIYAPRSIADKHTIKRYEQLKKYLGMQ